MSTALFRGQVEGIGVAPRLTIRDAHGEIVARREWNAEGFNHDAATREILTSGATLIAGTPVTGIGHRVVHGGMRYGAPVRLDRAVLASLSELTPLAPLHQPHNLAPIQTILDVAPHIPQVACFDTAFHRDQPQVAQSFALPRGLTSAGIRRYGFHGLSYEYLVSELRAKRSDIAQSRVIMAHLGNGASLCAVRDGRSVASTMGFTAVDGLMMGTRCGALDAGVLLHLMREYRYGCRLHRGSDLPEIGVAWGFRDIIRYAHASGILGSCGKGGNSAIRISYCPGNRVVDRGIGRD